MNMLKKLKLRILGALVLVPLAIMSGCTGDTTNNSSTNPNPNAFTPKGTVSGLLRDSVTNVPLAGATIAIMDRTAVTDAHGLFTITNVPAINGAGNEPTNANPQYPVVIDMAGVNAKIAAGKPKYPSTAYTSVNITYTSLGDSSSTVATVGSGPTTTATNHDTPVDGFVANIAPLVGKLDANVKIQVVTTKLAPVANADVYLFSFVGSSASQTSTGTGTDGTAASLGTSGGGTPGMLIAQAKSDANGYVTFTNIEAKKQFALKAVSGTSQGWFSGTSNAVAGLPTGNAGAVALLSPSDGLIDVYGLDQSGFTSGSPATATAGMGAYFSAPIVIGTVDNIAPFVLSSSISNLANIPYVDADYSVTFTFSEPIANTGNYASATTREKAVNNGNRGIYNNVVVSYLGPKAGNVDHTIEWVDNTHLKVTILKSSMTVASRYSVNITTALDGTATAGDRLKDANGNNFVSVAGASVFFTTDGGFNVAAPVISKTNAGSSLAIEWPTLSNAASYKVYVSKVNVTPFYAVGTAAGTENIIGGFATAGVYAVAGFPSFNLLTITGGPVFTNGGTYSIKVTAVNGSGSESEFSNVITFSDATPAAPTNLARRTAASNITETNVDWTYVAGQSYNVYVERVRGGVGLGYNLLAGSPITGGTVDVAAALVLGAGGSAFADGQLKVTYNVKITALSPMGSESTASNVITIDDKTPPTAAKNSAIAPATGNDIFGAGIAAAGQGVSTTNAGTIEITFDKPMDYTAVVSSSSWGFIFAGATTASVTQSFGGSLGTITWNGVTNAALVPWQVTTNGTGTIAAGAVTVSCSAKSIGGGLQAVGGF